MSDVLGIDNTYIHHFQEKDRRPLSTGDSPSFNRKNFYVYYIQNVQRIEKKLLY